MAEMEQAVERLLAILEGHPLEALQYLGERAGLSFEAGDSSEGRELFAFTGHPAVVVAFKIVLDELVEGVEVVSMSVGRRDHDG